MPTQQLSLTAAQIDTALKGVDGSHYIAEPPTGFTTPSYLTGIQAIKNGNIYDCSIKPEDLLDVSTYTNYLYVDYTRPDSSGDGRSWATAEKGIGQAIDTAITDAVATRIFVRGGSYTRAYTICNGNAAKVLTAPISIEAVYGRVETGTFDALTWSANGTYPLVYETTRSNSSHVIDPSFKDQDGDYRSYELATSLADCSANPGSWYTDNVTTYVHHFSSVPVSNANARVLLNAEAGRFNSNQDIYMRGIDIQGGSSGALKIEGGSTNKIVIDNCSAKFAQTGPVVSPTAIDGYQVLGCGLFAAFDSEASKNSKDGFNFHKEGANIPSALLVRCKGRGNGSLAASSVSNNGFTTHDGVVSVDIGGDWLGNYGAGSAHVNDGTQQWSVGSVSGDSVGDVILGGSLDYGAFGAWDGSPEMWLDSCRDVGAFSGIESGGTATVKTRNHSGTGIQGGAGTITTY